MSVSQPKNEVRVWPVRLCMSKGMGKLHVSSNGTRADGWEHSHFLPSNYASLRLQVTHNSQKRAKCLTVAVVVAGGDALRPELPDRKGVITVFGPFNAERHYFCARVSGQRLWIGSIDQSVVAMFFLDVPQVSMVAQFVAQVLEAPVAGTVLYAYANAILASSTATMSAQELVHPCSHEESKTGSRAGVGSAKPPAPPCAPACAPAPVCAPDPAHAPALACPAAPAPVQTPERVERAAPILSQTSTLEQTVVSQVTLGNPTPADSALREPGLASGVVEQAAPVDERPADQPKLGSPVGVIREFECAPVFVRTELSESTRLSQKYPVHYSRVQVIRALGKAMRRKEVQAGLRQLVESGQHLEVRDKQ